MNRIYEIFKKAGIKFSSPFHPNGDDITRIVADKLISEHYFANLETKEGEQSYNNPITVFYRMREALQSVDQYLVDIEKVTFTKQGTDWVCNVCINPPESKKQGE